MNNLFNYYTTNKLLCKDTNDITKNNLNKLRTINISIFNKYKTELLKLKNEINFNYDPLTNLEIEELSNVYENFKINIDVELFCKKVFEIRSKIASKLNIKSNIKELFKSNDQVILNPLYKSLLITSSLLNSSNFINNVNRNNISLDIYTQGKYINNSYPTLGIIYPILTKASTETYSYIIDLFNNILFNIHGTPKGGIINNFEEFRFKIPLQYSKLKFSEQICKLLDKSNLNKISSIKDYIDNVDLSMKDIMIQKDTNKKKTIYLFKEKYIIPYEFKNNEVVKIKSNKIISYVKDYKKYLSLEADFYYKVMNILTFQYNRLEKHELNTFYKILYLFYYRNIQLFYDIYWNFINKKVNYYVISLKLSNNSIYKNLNYEKFTNYIDKLNGSLLKMKKILLNNLYKIFLPNIIGKNYGVYIDKEYNDVIYLVNENILYTGKNIKDKYMIDNDFNGLLNVSTSTYFTDFNEHDHYDKNDKLFIGTLFNDNENLKSSLGLLTFDSGKLKKIRKVNYRIINYLIKIFNNCIPIEILDKKILSKKIYLKSSRLTNKDKSNLKNYILNEFDIYLKKSTENIILLKKSDESKHKILLLNSKINYNISYFIFRVVQTMLFDIQLKNELLSEIEKIKIKYLDLIKNKLK